MRIDTREYTEQKTIIIDDVEYAIAPRTVALEEKLRDIELEYVGKLQHKMWLAELNAILGSDAVSQIFPDGKNENVDKIQVVYFYVTREFMKVDRDLQAMQQEAKAEPVVNALRPVANVLNTIRATGDTKKK